MLRPAHVLSLLSVYSRPVFESTTQLQSVPDLIEKLIMQICINEEALMFKPFSTEDFSSGTNHSAFNFDAHLYGQHCGMVVKDGIASDFFCLKNLRY